MSYYAVIFISELTEDVEGYDEMSRRMVELAEQQDGFLGIDSARSGKGITVSYWSTEDAIRRWKQNLQHREAQILGSSKWYRSYKTIITKVIREYEKKDN